MKKIILNTLLTLGVVSSIGITATASQIQQPKGYVNASWTNYTNGGVVDGSVTGTYHSLTGGRTAYLNVSSKSSAEITTSLVREQFGPDKVIGKASFTSATTKSLGKTDKTSNNYYLAPRPNIHHTCLPHTHTHP